MSTKCQPYTQCTCMRCRQSHTWCWAPDTMCASRTHMSYSRPFWCRDATGIQCEPRAHLSGSFVFTDACPPPCPPPGSVVIQALYIRNDGGPTIFQYIAELPNNRVDSTRYLHLQCPRSCTNVPQPRQQRGS